MAKWETPRFHSLKDSFHPLIGMGVAEIGFGVAEPIAACMRDAADRGLLGYLTDQMEQEVIGATVARLARRSGWAVPAERVRLVSGGVRGYALALGISTDPGGGVVVSTPVYGPLLDVPAMMGLEVHQCPLRQSDGIWRHDVDRISELLRRGAQTLILCNPHNPVGRVWTKFELLELISLAQQYGARIISDEVFGPTSFPEHTYTPVASLEGAGEITTTIISASKAWNLAGLRCAQLVLPATSDALLRWASLNRLQTDGVSTLGALATRAAYLDGDEWLGRTILDLAELKNRLLSALKNSATVEISSPEFAPTAWARLTDATHGLDAFSELHRRGIQVTSSSDFGSSDTSSFRINYSLSEPQFQTALDLLT